MRKERFLKIKLLKAILTAYIAMAIIIAGLNYGYFDQVNPETASLINWFWHFYENWAKTIFIIIGSFLTLQVVNKSARTHMRKRNLQGFIVFAVIVHLIGPALLNNSELYLFSMPLPCKNPCVFNQFFG